MAIDQELYEIAIGLGTWPKNSDDAKFLLEGTGWYYMKKTGAIKSNNTRRVVLKPEWLAERKRLEKLIK